MAPKMIPGNPNRPAPGNTLRVEPIQRFRDIRAIKKMMAARPVIRPCSFWVSIQIFGHRDLLRIKVAQVRYLKPGDEIEIKEKKSVKLRRITLNKTAVAAIQGALGLQAYDDGDYLFKRAKGPVLTVPSLHRLVVKGWCRSINLRSNFGSHTQRKTWGCHQRVTFKLVGLN